MCIQVITRADDCGIGTGTNAAIARACEGGFIKNVSFMAPGPAIVQAADFFRDRKEVCLGMHFTITAEWERMRLRPSADSRQVPSLIGGDGGFYPDTSFGGTLPDLEEIRREWNAQLDTLTRLGLDISYGDTHMFPELAVPGLQEEMSYWMREKGLADHRYYYQALPCMDDLSRVQGLWEKIAARLTPGTYYYLCHPFWQEGASEKLGNNEMKERELIRNRQRDCLFASQEALAVCGKYKIQPISYREAGQGTTQGPADWLSGKIYGGYQIQAVDKRTFFLKDCFGDYFYLVEGEERAAVIDTGMGLPGLKDLLERLTDKPLMVLHTHGHLDHIGADGQFERIALHPMDQELFREHGQAAYRLRSVQALEKELKVSLNEEQLASVVYMDTERELLGLRDRERIDLGKRNLEVIHCPGHTKGSVCFYDEENGLLFSGDTLCSKGVMLNFPESVSIEEFVETICRLRERTRGVKAIYPGHHKVPLDASYYEKYLECAKRTLAHPEKGEWEESAFGSFRRFYYEDVSLTY